ncbi:MAG TPA: hypothetical protein VMH22_01130 [bacterium]|nr:hypothetical protein [bacterium]
MPGSINIDPRLNWYTLESDHFDVHFSCRGRPDSSSLQLAREVSSIAEEVHATITPVVGWVPRARTQIVIADFYDYSNGWAAPFPNNTITIIPTPPGGSKTNEGDWLRILILHEYSHILQIDRVAGVMAGLRKVFGRISMPNALAPAWLNEGYAVYNETRFTDFGRLRGTEYDMMARAAADSNRWLPVDRCGNYDLQRYPDGDAPYLYGSLLHGYVVKAAKTGTVPRVLALRGTVPAFADSSIWDRYNRERSAGLPYLENFYAQQTLGQSIYHAWSETQAEKMKPEAPSSSFILHPSSSLRRLTHEGYSTSSPLWSRSGAALFYVSKTDEEYPSIRMLDTATGQVTVLHRGLVTGNLSLSPDGRQLAFAELNLEGNYYEYEDIFTLDLQFGVVHQLTHGQRARDPDFAPDTSLLVFVSNDRGQNDLKLLDLATGKVSRLTETDDHTAYSSPRFSPGGKWIAVAALRPGGYTDIELIDRRTGWTISVTHDRANNMSPAWSRTGRLLFFVSDRSGVFNLYAYHLATGRTFAVTNVQYGVFEPAISPDNRWIAVTSYSASGYDISTTDFRSAEWQLAPEFKDTLPRDMTELSDNSDRVPTRAEGMSPATTHAPQLYYYNPFPGLLPAFWLPWLTLANRQSPFAIRQSLEVGAFTLGWDALQFHQYQLTAGYRFSHSSPFLSAAYTLSRYRPFISAAADIDQHQQQGNLGLELAYMATRHSNWLDLGLTALRDMTALSDRGSCQSSDDSDRVPSGLSTHADLDWTYSDAHQYRFDVAPVEGRVIGLHADAQQKALLSDKDLVRVLGYWYQYFGNAPQTWSLRSKLVVGTAFERAAPDAFELDNEPGLLGVRGYASESEPASTVLTAGLQFRAPLWWVERGIGTGPLFLQNINAAAFADFGLTSARPAPANCNLQTADSGPSRARIGVGAELRADVILSHLLPVSFTAGCGFGLHCPTGAAVANPLWSYRLYFGVSSSMLAGILESPLATRQSQIPSGLRHLPEAL